MSPLSVGLGWVAFAALTLTLLAGWTFTLGLARAAARPHTHRPADANPSTGSAGRCTTCTVPFCDEPVQIHVHAGHDWWTFCLTHGLPYLREEEVAS